MALSKILPAGQSQFAGARNLIINGAMQVAQRGTSASAANASYVSVDRYLTSITGGGAFTLSQETDTPSGQGFKNSLKATVDTADSSIAASDYYVIQYRIEGQNVAHLMLGTSDAVKVTLSFWVKSSLTGNHGASLENGAATRSYPFQYNISTANTWEKITKTFQLDTSGTWLTTDVTGLKLMLDLGSGTSFQGPADAWAGANYHTASSSVQLIATGSATWYITGIQLEVGEQATPFEHRSFGYELAACQRYYRKVDTFNPTYLLTVRSADDIRRLSHVFSTMRVNPTATILDSGEGTVTVQGTGKDNIQFTVSGHSTSNAPYIGSYTLDSEL